MPTTEERTAKLEGLTGQIDKRLTTFEGEVIRLHEKLDDRFDKVNERFEKVNNRIDQIINQMNTGFDRVNGRFEQVNNRFDQVNNRIDQKFNWLTGIMITMWVSLIITMLFK